MNVGGTNFNPGTLDSTQGTQALDKLNSKDLSELAKDPTLSQSDKAAVLKELAQKIKEEEAQKPQESQQSQGAGGPQGAGGGEDEEDPIKKLMKKLLAGTITPEEKDKLSQLTGQTPAALDQMASQANQPSPPDAGDIK